LSRSFLHSSVNSSPFGLATVLMHHWKSFTSWLILYPPPPPHTHTFLCSNCTRECLRAYTNAPLFHLSNLNLYVCLLFTMILLFHNFRRYKTCVYSLWFSGHKQHNTSMSTAAWSLHYDRVTKPRRLIDKGRTTTTKKNIRLPLVRSPVQSLEFSYPSAVFLETWPRPTAIVLRFTSRCPIYAYWPLNCSPSLTLKCSSPLRFQSKDNSLAKSTCMLTLLQAPLLFLCLTWRTKSHLLSTDHELIPQGMRVLRQCTVPLAEVMFVTIQRSNIQRKEWTMLLQCLLNRPMYAVRIRITTYLYRWPTVSLPSTCMLCTLLAQH
jgi:hypothetical protein